jgi:hypothetical protein
MGTLKVYVIGNGESRRGVPLERLYPTIGCNALYRDFTPTYLVAGDVGIVSEIREKYKGDFIYRDRSSKCFRVETPIHNVVRVIPFPQWDNSLSWYSGVSAAYLAPILFDEVTDVYLIGFDGLLLQEGDKAVNNLYKGTPGYCPPTEVQDRALNTLCHQRSFKAYVFDPLPHIKFHLVGNGVLPLYRLSAQCSSHNA